MSDDKPDQLKTNPHRSATPARRLTASELGISLPAAQDEKTAEVWEELRTAIDTMTVDGDGARAAVATVNETVQTSVDIQKGASQSIHAIELAVWKAYSEQQNPITHVLVQPTVDEYDPCGRCLQVVADYSNCALVRVVSAGGDDYREYSLSEPSLLEADSTPVDAGDCDVNNPAGANEEPSQSESADLRPGLPSTPDIDTNGQDGEIEYIRLNAPVYHLKYKTREQTLCGTDLSEREYVASSEQPVLLDPCKPCHGETSVQTIEQQRAELRAQISERVDAVDTVETNAATFDETELEAILEEIPSEPPTGERTAAALRRRLSRTVAEVNDDPESPLWFSRPEMEALVASLDGDGIISNEPYLFIYTSARRVTRIPLSELIPQHRGGKGESTLPLDTDESSKAAFAVNPREQLYLFTNFGQIHCIDAYRIPSEADGGPAPLADIVKMDDGERLQSACSCRTINNREYVVIGTQDGYIKRTPTDRFGNIHRGGIRAVELDEGDAVRGIDLTDGESDILLSTQDGRTIRFEESDMRPMGRTARGVLGIQLDDGDEVIAVNAVPPTSESEVLTVTTGGYGKRTGIEEYRRQTRNGRGLIDIDTGDRNGTVTGVTVISRNQEVVTLSAAGRTIRIAVNEITQQGRNTKGVRIMALDPEDTVSTVVRFDT